MKRALYVIEDNLKPGNKEYDHARERLQALVLRNKEHIDSIKNDEIKTQIDLEQLENSIRREL